MSPRPRIIYVPGLKPKPPATEHREQLQRCLVEGLKRVDPEVAEELLHDEAFELVSWTFDFYGEHRDIGLDIDDINLLLSKSGPSERDLETVTSLKRRLTRWVFRTGDYLPFLIPHFATEELEIHLRDFNKYLRNNRGVAEEARQKVRNAVVAASQDERPILLIGHSMGSVIAYEALWQLSREQNSALMVDRLLTSGSPLGQSFVQRHLLGWDKPEAEKYPANIRRWSNVAAVGELTAIDMQLQNDFGAMLSQGLVEDIEDLSAFNYYYMNGALNVHAEYGYLVNEVTAKVVRDWWRAARTG